MDRREFLEEINVADRRSAWSAVPCFPKRPCRPPKSGSRTAFRGRKKRSGSSSIRSGAIWAKTPRGSLQKISDMGYSAAETASYGDGKFYGRTPAEFRKMAEDVGIAGHRSAPRPRTRQERRAWLHRLVEAGLRRAGCRRRQVHRHCRASTSGRRDADLQRTTATTSTSVGEPSRTRPGLRFGYHNHAARVQQDQDGQVIEDYLLEHTDPDKVVLRTGRILGQQGRRQSVGLHSEIRRPLPAAAHQGRGYHRSQRDDRFRVDLQGGLQAGTRRVLRRDRGQLASAHALRPQKRRIPQRIEVRQVET